MNFETFKDWWESCSNKGTEMVEVDKEYVNYRNFEDSPNENISLAVKVIGEERNYYETAELLPEDAREIADELYEIADELEQ